MVRNTRAIEVMNFCTTSPVTRILHFCVICSLHVHMFTKPTLSGLILSRWLLIYDIVHVASCNKSGHLRRCPSVQFLREKKGGEGLLPSSRHTCPSLFPHWSEACAASVKRRFLLNGNALPYFTPSPHLA